MTSGNNVDTFLDGVRLAWAVHLMLIQDTVTPREHVPNASSNDLEKIFSCLEVVFKNNVFQSLLDNVLRTAAYQVL